MILEIATIQIAPERRSAFESSFAAAEKVITQARGYRAHELQRSIENAGRYLLLVEWDSVEAHTVGFRQSPLFDQWRAIIGPYFQQPPVVEHCTMVSGHPKAQPVKAAAGILQD